CSGLRILLGGRGGGEMSQGGPAGPRAGWGPGGSFPGGINPLGGPGAGRLPGASANALHQIVRCCSWTAPGRGGGAGVRGKRVATALVPRHTDSDERNGDELSRSGGRGGVLAAF